MLNLEQAKALKKLADAYDELGNVWDSSGGPNDWNGPENFGGVLDGLGVLPEISLDEAAFELETLYQESMIGLNALDIIRDTFHGSTQYESQDETYFYFSTTHEGKGDLVHRVAKESIDYESKFLCDNYSEWLGDELVTKAIQKEQLKLFPSLVPAGDEKIIGGQTND